MNERQLKRMKERKKYRKNERKKKISIVRMKERNDRKNKRKE